MKPDLYKVSEIGMGTLFVMPKQRSTSDDDAYTYIQPVGPTTPASTSTLVVGDYDQAGAVDSPTVWSDTKNTYSDTWSDGTYVEFPFNTSGLAGVFSTTTTMVSMREGHDIEDVAPDGGSDNEWGFYPAEYGSESKRPYLEITYTVDLD